MKRLSFLLSLLAIAGWFGYGAYLASTLPRVEILEAQSLAASGRTLPFYDLMSPVPDGSVLPKLEYKKGPPERYIERITLLVQGEGAREKVAYYGRRTRNDLPGLSLFPEGPNREARYFETALRLSQGQDGGLSGWRAFLLKPLLLREASRWLGDAERVHVMEQAGAPAFLFERNPRDGRSRATALFIRRNSFYRVEYASEGGFRNLDPLRSFRQSFLIEKRVDALNFLAQNLSEVRIENKAGDLRQIAWPILLLAAKASVDPASLETYFHFAGISALLYRSPSLDRADAEVLDVLRNNVLASEFYARDLNPESQKTAEIGRLSRLLQRSFE